MSKISGRSTYRPMTARLDGASSGFGFSTSPVTARRRRSSVGSTVAMPYRWTSDGVDLQQRDDAGAALGLLGDHPGQQHVPAVDDVVAEQHGERLVAHVHPGAAARRARVRAGRPGARSARRPGRSSSSPSPACRCRPCCRSVASSSPTRSKWFSSAFLLRPVIMSTSVSPAATASSTTYWIAGLSTTGSISFGIALVAGRNRVPRPAAGMTALVIWKPMDVRLHSVRE